MSNGVPVLDLIVRLFVPVDKIWLASETRPDDHATAVFVSLVSVFDNLLQFWNRQRTVWNNNEKSR